MTRLGPFSTGMGSFCWIKDGMVLLIIVGIPVALAILFNFIALTWTVIAIYKVQKVRTSRRRLLAKKKIEN